jgi:MIP family channel proteins
MNFKALLAEFIGTFALIFVGVGAIAANAASGGSSGLTGVALAHGLTIAVMVSATAAISGGHLNPAVSFGAMLGGKLSPVNFIAYAAAQCLGAVVAAMLAGIFLPTGIAAVAAGTPALAQGISTMQAAGLEAVATFFLVFVVFGTAIDERAPKVGGLFIGLTIALGILMIGPFTGGAINPARFMGPALVSGAIANCGVYWIGPLVGGGLAGLVYSRLLR